MSGPAELIDDVVNSLRDLGLSQIPATEVEAIWESDFTEYDTYSESMPTCITALPAVSQVTPQLCKQVHRLNRATARNRRSIETNDGDLWQQLQTAKVASRNVPVFVYYGMERAIVAAQDSALTSSQIKIALYCTQIYWSMVSLRGAAAYKMHNNTLMKKTMDVYRTAGVSVLGTEGVESMQSRLCGGGQRGAKAKHNKHKRKNDDEESTVGLDAEQGLDVRDLLDGSVAVLLQSLRATDLQLHHNVTESAVNALSSLLMIDGDGVRPQRLANDDADDMNIAEKVLATFQLFSSQNRLAAFRLDDSAQQCLSRFCMPCLLLSPQQHLTMAAQAALNQTTTVPTALIKLRDLALLYLNTYADRLMALPDTDADKRHRLMLVVCVLQHMLPKCTDKADYRSKVVTCICQTVLRLRHMQNVPVQGLIEDQPENTNLLLQFCQFLEIFSTTKRPPWRGIGIECAVALYRMLDDDSEEAQLVLCRVVLMHCTDRAPSCRQKSIAALGQMVAHDGARTQRLCQTVLRQALSERERRAEESQDEEAEQQQQRPEHELRVNRLLMRALADDKSMVRKAAITTAEAYLMAQLPDTCDDDELAAEVWPNQLLLMVCKSGCDPTLSVRKQAAESMTAVLQARPLHRALAFKWLAVVLPLITDRENSLVDTALRLSRAVIFDHIVTRSDKSPLAWALLDVVERKEHLRRYLSRVLVRLNNPSGKERTGADAVVARLVAAVDTIIAEHRHAQQHTPWMLMADLSLITLVPHASAVREWRRVSDECEVDGSGARLLKYINVTLANAAHKVPQDDALELLHTVKERILQMRVAPECVAGTVYTIYKLYHRTMGAQPAAVLDAMRTFAAAVVAKCEKYLAIALFSNAGATTAAHQSSIDDNTANELEEPTDEGIIRRLCSLAELTQYAPKLITTRHFKMVEAFLCMEQIKRDLTVSISNRPGSSQTQNEAPDATGSGETTGGGGPSSQPRPTATYSKMLRAQAVVALGKLCLHDEASANECVQLLIREMTTNAQDTMRNNCLIVLADLAVRYTALVEPHLASITSCLKDASQLVRQQTLTVLTSLIKEDYLRFKGLLLYRFMSALLDRDAHIRQFTEFCLVHVLKVRHPTMFSHHFIECVYHFNGCRHPSWTGEQTAVVLDSERQVRMFSLKGAEKSASRMQLYNFMLSQFDDVQKFEAMSKLCSDVLGLVSEDLIPVDDQTELLIADTLKILSCDNIKLTAIKRAKSNALEDEIEDERDAAVESKYNKYITAVMRKATFEQIIPTLIALKHKFAEYRRSALQKLLSAYLVELCSDFDADIKEVLVADPQLAAEVEFDIRQAKEQQEREKERQRKEAELAVRRAEKLARIAARKSVAAAEAPAAQQDREDENEQDKENIDEQAVATASGSQSEDDEDGQQQPPVTPERVQHDNEQVAVLTEHMARLRGSPMPAISEDGDELADLQRSANSKRKFAEHNAADDTVTGVPTRAISTPQRGSAVSDMTFALDITAMHAPNDDPVLQTNKRPRRSTRRQ